MSMYGELHTPVKIDPTKLHWEKSTRMVEDNFLHGEPEREVMILNLYHGNQYIAEPAILLAAVGLGYTHSWPVYWNPGGGTFGWFATTGPTGFEYDIGYGEPVTERMSFKCWPATRGD